ncbi:MAG: alpha-mannosidase [Promethearchaeota archaeon]
MNNEKVKKLLLVSHTHWDREWYLTFEQFRLRLLRVIDKALSLADKKGWNSFMLDGQTAPLLDYLEMKPGKESMLKKAIKDEKLIVGPWFVLADEFLETGEGLIRNLLIGHQISDYFGSVMKVGYVPDTFGHIWQLPQILLGFNIKSCYMFRGYPPLFGGHEEYKGHGDDTPLEFYWSAPDGSKVLTLHHITGYGNAGNLGEGSTTGQFKFMNAIMKILMAVQRLEPRTSTSIFLLMNGGDHLEPEEQIPEIIDFFNGDEDLSREYHLTHGSLEDYFNELSKSRVTFPTLSGEMRGSAYTQVTPACLSSRMYLKQDNWQVSNELEMIVEPLSTIAWYLGARYPIDEIHHLWKKILLNHPHDSICGCSIDRVHDDMEVRYKEAMDIITVLEQSAFNFLASRLKNEDDDEDRMHLFVFNSSNWIQDGPVRKVISLPIKWNNKNVELFDFNGEKVEEFKLKEIKDYRKLPGGDRLYPVFNKNYSVHEIEFIASRVPSIGFKTYYLRCNDNKSENESNDGDTFPGNALENEFFKLTINPDGTIDLLDKKKEKTWKKLLIFEDSGDDGDEYDYAPLHEPEDVYSIDFKLESMQIKRDNFKQECEMNLLMKVPREISDESRKRIKEKVDLPIFIKIILYKMEPLVRLQIDVENTAKDHRLRVLFSTNLQTDVSHAADHFMVMERPIALPRDYGWYQPAQGLYHTDGFVDLSDGQDGLSIFLKGLPEFEIIDENKTIAITLFRSVGWLSRGGMPISRGHLGRPSGLNGPALPTPGAQCLRKMRFDLALQPHEGNWIKGNLYKTMKRYQGALRCFLPMDLDYFHDIDGNKDAKPFVHDPEQAMISLSPDTLVISAVKKGEKDNSIILRVFNPSGKDIQAKVSLSFGFQSVSRVNLNEELIESILDVDDGGFKAKFDPFEIITFSIIPKRMN